MDEPGQAAFEESGSGRPVFISYASADRKQALRICNALERRNIPCWISCRDVRAGENYQEAIVRELRMSRAIVLVFSSAANTSNEIKKELSLASRYHKTVMALRIENEEPSDAFAYELSTRQWIDAFGSLDKAVAKLVGQIEQLAEGANRPVVAEDLRGSRFSAVRGLSKTALAAMLALLVLVTAAGAYWLIRERQPERLSIAVLPFNDLSPTHDKAYFGEGVAEEILSTLAAEKGIKVLGRSSAQQVARNSDPKAIRASLGVTHLLEGSTRTSGNDLRVNVRLVDTSDGSQLWEEQYDGKMGDVFAVQDKIAATVVRRLRGTLLAGSLRPSTPTSIDAYEAYLAARALIRQNKQKTILRAWQMARQIVDTNPDYAPGHALFAETTMLLSESTYGYGVIPYSRAHEIGLPHAQAAIRLAPERAEGYAALGLFLPRRESIKFFEKALQLDPSRTDVRLRLGLAFDVAQEPQKAFDEYRSAAELDPVAPAIINRYIQILASSGQTREAQDVVEKFVRGGGSTAQAWRFKGAIYGYQVDLSQSLAARKRALKLDPNLPYQHGWIVQTNHLLGLDELSGPHLAGAPLPLRHFVANDHAALKERIFRDVGAAWNESGTDLAIFSLARARDWATIARFYARRPEAYRDYCAASPQLSPLIVMALAQQGNRREASDLLACKLRQVDRLLNLRFRSPDLAPGELDMTKASLLAVRGDPKALQWLEKAVARGWIGQYYSSRLADWPQFDAYRADPNYAALQKRIDAVIARERAKTLALG